MKAIWFSEIKWSYLKTRKQHMIEHFPADWHVLFIETYVRGKQNRFLPKRDGRVTAVTVPFMKSTPIPWLNRVLESVFFRWTFNALAALWLAVLFRFLGFHGRERVLFTSNIYFADLLSFFRRRLLIYDCNDYPPGFPGALRTAPSYFRKTVERADLVITVSDELRRDVEALGQANAVVIGNGVDFELFANDDRGIIPDELAGVPPPVIMYVGVFSDWFDFDLVARVARECSHASVVLVGPAISDKARSGLAELSRLPNVRPVGAQPHAELPVFIRCASVCMIPFLKNDLIRRFSPNKLYEYLAAGKPVVTLDYTKEIVELNPVVSVAQNADEFVEMIRRGIDHPHDPGVLRQAARSRSWKAISREIADRVLQLLDQRDE
jgi:glycosyltransferase involved in cell wall biosynthesis